MTNSMSRGIGKKGSDLFLHIKPNTVLVETKKGYTVNRVPSNGDGGNRTRVRKIQPLNVYKRSRPI